MTAFAKDMRKSNIIYCAVIFLVTIGIYWNSLQGDFIWDDRGLILESTSYLRDWRNIFQSFTSPFFGATPFYRPLLLVSFIFDYQLWGLNPFGFHLNNVLLHALNACMVYLLAFLLFKRRILAFAVGLLFTTHPIQTEAVAWISGRNDVLLTFFALITIICFLKWRHSEGRKRVSAYTCFLLGYCCVLLTKESGIIVPVLIVLIDYFFRNTLPPTLGVNKKTYLPLMVISVLYMCVRMYLLGRSDFAIVGLDASQTLSGIILTYAYYFKLLLFPVFQSANPVIIPPVLSVKNPACITAFMLTALLVLITVSCWYRFWELSFIILWICVTLLPVSGIVPLAVPALEHRLYLGSVCFSMVIPLLLYKTVHSGAREPTLSNRSLCSVSILLALILVYSAKTVIRNTIWQDEQTFWLRTLRASPSSAFAHNNLGVIYARQGNYNKAISIFKKGLSLSPTEEFWDRGVTKDIRLKMYNNLGKSYRALFEKQLGQEVKREEKALPRGGNTGGKQEGT